MVKLDVRSKWTQEEVKYLIEAYTTTDKSLTTIGKELGKSCYNVRHMKTKLNLCREVSIDTSTLKTCTKCKEIKSILEFSRNKHCKDGRRFTCKSCDKIYRMTRVIE